MTKNRKLRAILAKPGVVMAPCAFDALSALAIEQAGFDLIGTTGYGIHGSHLGMPDNGLLSFAEMLDVCGRIADAVQLPVLADAEGGYGNAVSVVRTVRSFEKAGLSGLFIEDQKLPPSCPFIREPELISTDEMVGKIRAARDARKDPDFMIVARTDAPFDEAIERVNTYFEAGADMVKVIPKTRQELERYPARIDGPIHLGFIVGKQVSDGLTAWDAGKMGYKIVTFPMSGLFSSVHAMQRVLRTIREQGTDEALLSHMIPFDDYTHLVGAGRWQRIENQYLFTRRQ